MAAFLRIMFLIVFALLTIITPVRGQTPRTAEGFIDRGIERQNKGDLDGAIEDFSKAISLRPQTMVLAAAYNNRANARVGKNDVESHRTSAL